MPIGSSRPCASPAPNAGCSVRARLSRHASVHFPLPAWAGCFGRSLLVEKRLGRIVDEWRPDRLIPLDEAAAQVLLDPQLYARADSGLRGLLQRSFGAPASVTMASSRRHFIEMAGAIGIRTPPQATVKDLGAARRAAATLGCPVELKREQIWGAAGSTSFKTHRA